MKIKVRIKPNSKQERVEKAADGSFNVWVRAKPVEGKANEALVGAIADHFAISKSKVTILIGERSKDKILKVIL